MHNLQFLPTEIQSSIDALRAAGAPLDELDRLVDRILHASEAKTTSLQMDIARIETAFERRYGLFEDKLIADDQARTGGLYEMISEVRNAQINAHPQITQALDGVHAIQKTNEDIEIWVGRLERAFIIGRDFAADERARLETKLNEVDGRVAVIEEILELKPKAGDG